MTMDLEKEEKIFFAIIATILLVFVVFLAWAIPASRKADNEWKAWCVSQGGHVISKTDTQTNIASGPKGQPIVVTSTNRIKFCIDRSGRVLGIG